MKALKSLVWAMLMSIFIVVLSIPLFLFLVWMTIICEVDFWSGQSKGLSKE